MQNFINNINAKFLKLLLYSGLISIVVQPLYAQDLFSSTNQPFGEYLVGRHALANNQFDIAADNYLKALNLDTDNILLNQLTLSILVTDGRLADAVKISNKLRDIDQQNDLSKLMLFFEKTKSGDYEDLLVTGDGQGTNGILKLINPFFKAWVLAERGEIDQVETIINEFKAGNSLNFFNYFQSAIIYEYLGDNKKAEKYYSMALLDNKTKNLRVAEALGKLLSRQGKDEQALFVLNKFSKINPSNEHLRLALETIKNGEKFEPFISTLNDGFAELLYTVASILMQDDMKRVATNYLQYAVFFKPNFPLVHLLQAKIFESDEYFMGAIRELEKINNNSPIYLQSKLQRARIFDQIKLPSEVLKALKILESEYPENRSVLNEIAEFYRTHERYEEAIEVYNKVVTSIVKENKDDWVLYYFRGIVLDQEKRWPEAESDFKKALELNPNQPLVLNYLAYSWVEQGRNYKEAKIMLLRAVELRPNDGYIADSLGWALFKMGDGEEAVPILERAVQLQTKDWAINDHLGDAYWVVGRQNEARFQWRHALSLKQADTKGDQIEYKIINGYK